MGSVRQLKEIFPNVSEDFLKGLCEAYKDDDLSVPELVEVVLTFENPPLEKPITNHDSNVVEQQLTNRSVDIIPDNIREPVDQINEHKHNAACTSTAEPINDSKHPEGMSKSLVNSPNQSFDMDVIEIVDKHNESIIDLTQLEDSPIVTSKKLDSASHHNSVEHIQLSCESSEPPTSSFCKVDALGNEISLESETTELPDENNVPLKCEVNTALNHHPSDTECTDKMSFLETDDYVVVYNTHKAEDRGLKDLQSENLFSGSWTQNVLMEVSSSNLTRSQKENVCSFPDNKSTPDSLVGKDKDINYNQVNLTKLQPLATVFDSDIKQVNEIEEFTKTEMLKTSEQTPSAQSTSFDSKVHSQNSNKIHKRLRKRSRLSTSEEDFPIKCSQKRPFFLCSKLKHDDFSSKTKQTIQRKSSLSKTHKNTCECSHNPSQFQSVQSKFSLLYKIFPDSDVEYMLSKSQQIADAEELLVFIEKLLDSRDYPKMQIKVEPKKIESFNCTIQDFLDEIPDPNAEFSSDNYIRTGYEGNAEIYLQTRYQKLDPDLMKENLRYNKYNLTKICDDLESHGQEISPYVLDDIILHHEASVFFHQEVWFIEHKNEIRSFLDSVVEAARIEEEINRPPTPPQVEEKFECEICRGEVTEYSQLGTCDGPSGHLFCLDCVKRHIEIQFSEGVTNFPCLTNCGGYIPPQTAKEVLSPQMFSILMEKIQEAEVRAANIPGVETCPFCPFAYGPDDDTLFYCQNPSCLKSSCRVCKKEDHTPELCAIFQMEDEEAARLYIENRMTEALIRHCHSCGKGIVKSDGCNKMTCRCGALMCYLCRQPVKDYSHFNGPGGDQTERCELYSNETTIHDRPVAESAKRAVEELIANNPGINLDPQKLIPK